MRSVTSSISAKTDPLPLGHNILICAAALNTIYRVKSIDSAYILYYHTLVIDSMCVPLYEDRLSRPIGEETCIAHVVYGLYASVCSMTAPIFK